MSMILDDLCASQIARLDAETVWKDESTTERQWHEAATLRRFQRREMTHYLMLENTRFRRDAGPK